MAADYLNRQEDLLEPVSIVDDYTGQNNFHILIANGANCGGIAAAEMLFSIVTYEPFRQRLLRGRATGRFFCPYYGTVHLGTTPLHFAVLSQQISFVKLILERLCKSDIERLDVLWDHDNSGNMVLHLAVMADNIEIYDYLRHSFLYLEALLTKGKTVDGRILKSIQTDSYIKNYLNFTPLELAAALGKREMLNHMINSDVVTIWEYNAFSLKGYAMRDIDTFKTLALDRWQLAQTVRPRSRLQSHFFCIIDHAYLCSGAGDGGDAPQGALESQCWSGRRLELCTEMAVRLARVAGVQELLRKQCTGNHSRTPTRRVVLHPWNHLHHQPEVGGLCPAFLRFLRISCTLTALPLLAGVRQAIGHILGCHRRRCFYSFSNIRNQLSLGNSLRRKRPKQRQWLLLFIKTTLDANVKCRIQLVGLP
jgi:ankyrin repeat protein